MKSMVPIVLISLALCLAACGEPTSEFKDPLLEAARGMAEVLDSPLSRGRTLYNKYCSVCHGSQGQGDGFNAYNLDPRPRSFKDSSFIARLDTALVVETITGGGAAVGLSPTMPPWGRTLKRNDIALLSHYVVHLSESSAE